MEKHRYNAYGVPNPNASPRRASRSSRTLRPWFLASCLCLLAIYTLLYKPQIPFKYPQKVKDGLDTKFGNGSAFERDSNTKKRVPFEAHIMSKCPDAQDCLQDLIVPTMVRIHDKVDFQLSFIGNFSESSSGVSCMHGPDECLGNMLLLCAANLPFHDESNPSNLKTPTVRSLGFANCMLSRYTEIPDRSLVEDCSLEFGINFNELNKCASSQSDEQDQLRDLEKGRDSELSGLALLRESFKRSESLGVKKSCTVRVNEKVWCIRDGGEWTDCREGGGNVDVLVKEIEKLYKERN